MPDNSVGVEYINICLRAYQRKQERSLLRLCFLELEQEYSKEQSVEQSSGPCGHLSTLQKLPSVEYSRILILSQCHVTSEEGSCILRFRSKPFMSTEAEEALDGNRQSFKSDQKTQFKSILRQDLFHAGNQTRILCLEPYYSSGGCQSCTATEVRRCSLEAWNDTDLIVCSSHNSFSSCNSNLVSQAPRPLLWFPLTCLW